MRRKHRKRVHTSDTPVLLRCRNHVRGGEWGHGSSRPGHETHLLIGSGRVSYRHFVVGSQSTEVNQECWVRPSFSLVHHKPHPLLRRLSTGHKFWSTVYSGSLLPLFHSRNEDMFRPNLLHKCSHRGHRNDASPLVDVRRTSESRTDLRVVLYRPVCLDGSPGWVGYNGEGGTPVPSPHNVVVVMKVYLTSVLFPPGEVRNHNRENIRSGITLPVPSRLAENRSPGTTVRCVSPPATPPNNNTTKPKENDSVNSPGEEGTGKDN